MEGVKEMTFRAGYLNLLKSGELEKRVEATRGQILRT